MYKVTGEFLLLLLMMLQAVRHRGGRRYLSLRLAVSLGEIKAELHLIGLCYTNL